MGEPGSVEGAVDQVMRLLEGAEVIAVATGEVEAVWKCNRVKQRICTPTDPHANVPGLQSIDFKPIICGWTYE